jgi:hypothetical protein
MVNIDWIGLARLFIISLALPSLVAWLSSDLRVAQMQKKRNHYLELVKSFENWRDDLHLFAPIGGPFPTSYEFEPLKLTALSNLEYYHQFKGHMESGYPDLWAKWEKLNSGIIEHNIAHAKLLNDIVARLRLIAEKYKTRAIFPYYEKQRPRSYIAVDKMALRVFAETNFRLERNPVWRNTDLKYQNKTTYPDGSEVHFWESWGDSVIYHEKREDAENIINDFKALVDDDVFQDRIYSIIANEKKWGKEIIDFKDSIQQESDKIHLGNDMKGKCTICRQFSILSKIFSAS